MIALVVKPQYTGSYDVWVVRFVAIGPRCDRSAMFATISSSSGGRIPRSISTRGRAITIDWRISMARAIVGNRATSGSYQRSMVRSIDRCILRPIVRAIVASCDRSYEHSWHPVTERTINRGTRRPMVRSIVAIYNRSYDQSCHQTIFNRRLEVLNMTIDLATTDFALAITHDHCDQSYVLSTMCPRFQHFSFAGKS